MKTGACLPGRVWRWFHVADVVNCGKEDGGGSDVDVSCGWAMSLVT